MNQVFYVIGASLCYVGGFALMILILGIIAELVLEVWSDIFEELCILHDLNPLDVISYSQFKKEFDEWLETH